jgi:HKD family nuclease
MKKDFFEEIRAFDHNLGMYHTFTLNKEVIEKIHDSSGGRTVIFHDFHQGVTLDNLQDNRILCIPVKPLTVGSNLFHSKIALLKGKEKNRLIVGSMNLSKDSFSYPKEVCCSMDIEPDSDIHCAVVDYFKSLKGQVCIDSSKPRVELLIKEITPLQTKKIHKNRDIRFVYSSEYMSISEQMLSFLDDITPKKAPILRIASPYMSDGEEYSRYFQEFIDRVKPKSICLYLRRNTKIPLQMRIHEPIKVYSPKKKGNKDIFHAKIVMLDYGEKQDSIIYIGSANFTKQGFFQNLIRGANNECGIIVRMRNEFIREWFNTGWDDPVNSEDYIADGESKPSYALKPYAWAEREEGRNISVYLFLPKDVPIDNVQIKGHKNSKFKQADETFDLAEYQVTIASKDNKIIIYLPIEPFTLDLEVFDFQEFSAAKSRDGESLFLYSSEIESIRESEVKKAIMKSGIKVNVTGGVDIREPPVLEQFFHNVNGKVRAINSRRYFTESDKDELQGELKEQTGGPGLYLISQLSKVFRDKNENLDYVCIQRAGEITKEMDMPFFGKGGFKSFLDRWANDGKD